jgi:8-oxo-dGTP diphosphatase
MSSQIPILHVAAKAAIIDKTGNVLIVREAKKDSNTQDGFWGLVGGKLEAGESFTDGLNREVLEETGLTVTSKVPLQVGEWRPEINGIKHQIIAIFMLCETSTRNVRLSHEHDDFAWINPRYRHDYPMMEPDCYVVDKLV